MNEYGERKGRWGGEEGVGVGVTIWESWSYLERIVEELNGEVE